MTEIEPKRLGLEDCEKFYVERVQHLERFKKEIKRQLHANWSSLEELSQTPNHKPSSVSAHILDQLGSLKYQMVTLMEKDIMIMRELLSMSESIQDLKLCTSDQPPSPASSEGSLTDSLSPCLRMPNPSHKRSPFGRQNSILRIPIPPLRHRKSSRNTGDRTQKLDRVLEGSRRPPSPLERESPLIPLAESSRLSSTPLGRESPLIPLMESSPRTVSSLRRSFNIDQLDDTSSGISSTSTLDKTGADEQRRLSFRSNASTDPGCISEQSLDSPPKLNSPETHILPGSLGLFHDEDDFEEIVMV